MFGIKIISEKRFNDLVDKIEQLELLSQRRLEMLLNERRDNSSLREQLNDEILRNARLKGEISSIADGYKETQKDLKSLIKAYESLEQAIDKELNK